MNLIWAISGGVAVLLMVCIFLVVRREWVHTKSMKAIYDDTYNSLPSYDTMLYKFWIWDIERFKK